MEQIIKSESESGNLVNSVALNNTESSTVEYAGFWRRFVGYYVDYMIISIMILIVVTIFSKFFNYDLLSAVLASKILNIELSQGAIWRGVTMLITSVGLYFVIWTVYYCSFEVSKLQATPGKYIVGIKVTDLNGEKITFNRALIRRLSAILSTLVFFIGYLFSAFTEKKQTFHDILANTLVVKNSKRSVLFLVTVCILTFIAGLTLNWGSYVDPSNNSISSENEDAFVENYSVVLKSTEVNSELKESIIDGYKKQQEVMLSGDVDKIRKHLTDSVSDRVEKSMYEVISDAEIKRTSDTYVEIGKKVTESDIRKSDSIWSFDAEKTKVKIGVAKVENGVKSTSSVSLSSINGVWR
jgi:uncharacterized RDD family membrane protein YckC